MTRYTVETLKSGQPWAYADTEREYRVTVEDSGWQEGSPLKPSLMFGDVEARIKREVKDRAEGRMFGGESPDQLRKAQRDWALGIIRTLCQIFREKDDKDGREGMEAHFYPTLKWMRLDPKAGTIHAFIIEPYAD